MARIETLLKHCQKGQARGTEAREKKRNNGGRDGDLSKCADGECRFGETSRHCASLRIIKTDPRFRQHSSLSRLEQGTYYTAATKIERPGSTRRLPDPNGKEMAKGRTTHPYSKMICKRNIRCFNTGPTYASLKRTFRRRVRVPWGKTSTCSETP